MDIEIKASCQRCTTEFFMGTQTHSFSYDRLYGPEEQPRHNPMVGGMCPHCNAYVTVVMKQDRIRIYAPIEEGVHDAGYHKHVQ
jgi:hypothetical protein